jgi:hypothetical protein
MLHEKSFYDQKSESLSLYKKIPHNKNLCNQRASFSCSITLSRSYAHRCHLVLLANRRMKGGENDILFIIILLDALPVLRVRLLGVLVFCSGSLGLLFCHAALYNLH